jgi:hypothetical protein
VTPGLNLADAANARLAAISQLQAGAQPGTSKQVVSLYAGAVYNLYTYKVYSDVRLVFGAEFQAGFYGGDPDNFTFPRYCLDVGMFRLYENDKPALTPHFLKWSPAGTKEGELVFTTGHPGATQRLNTVAHLKYRRDLAIPFAIAVKREPRSLQAEVDGPERRERAAEHERSLWHPEHPEVAARAAQGPPGSPR